MKLSKMKRSDAISVALVLSSLLLMIFFVLMMGGKATKTGIEGKEFIEDYYNYQEFLSTIMLGGEFLQRYLFSQLIFKTGISYKIDPKDFFNIPTPYASLNNKSKGILIGSVTTLDKDGLSYFMDILNYKKKNYGDFDPLFIFILYNIPHDNVLNKDNTDIYMYPTLVMFPFISTNIVTNKFFIQYEGILNSNYSRIIKNFYDGVCGIYPKEHKVCIKWKYEYVTTNFKRNFTLMINYSFDAPIIYWNDVVYQLYKSFYDNFVNNGTFFQYVDKNKNENITLSIVSVNSTELLDKISPLIAYNSLPKYDDIKNYINLSDKIIKSYYYCNSKTIESEPLTQDEAKKIEDFLNCVVNNNQQCNNSDIISCIINFIWSFLNSILNFICCITNWCPCNQPCSLDWNELYSISTYGKISNINDEQYNPSLPILPDIIYYTGDKSDIIKMKDYLNEVRKIENEYRYLSDNFGYRFLVPVKLNVTLNLTFCVLYYKTYKEYFNDRYSCEFGLNLYKNIDPELYKNVKGCYYDNQNGKYYIEYTRLAKKEYTITNMYKNIYIYKPIDNSTELERYLKLY